MRYTVFYLRPAFGRIVPAFDEIEVRMISNGYYIEPEYPFVSTIPDTARFSTDFVYNDVRTALTQLSTNKDLRRRIIKENYSCFFINKFCLMRCSINDLLAIMQLIKEEKLELEAEENASKVQNN